MELIINGDQRLIDSSYSLMDLLVSLEMTQGHIAVELNGEIIPKSTFQHNNSVTATRLKSLKQLAAANTGANGRR